jgi:hypothetical protein
MCEIGLFGVVTVQAGIGLFQSTSAASRARSRCSGRLRLKGGGARWRGYGAMQERARHGSFPFALSWECGGSLWALLACRRQGQSEVTGRCSRPFGRGVLLGRGVEGSASSLARLGGQACCISS